MFGIVIAFFLLFFSIRTKPIKQEELMNSTGQAMQDALRKSMEENYTNAECVKLFLDLLEESMGERGELQAEIYYIDVEEGIFRAKVSMEFTYLHGQKNVVETERTVIYDGEWGEGV